MSVEWIVLYDGCMCCFFVFVYWVGDEFDFWFFFVNECMFLVWICIGLVLIVGGVVFEVFGFDLYLGFCLVVLLLLIIVGIVVVLFVWFEWMWVECVLWQG